MDKIDFKDIASLNQIKKELGADRFDYTYDSGNLCFRYYFPEVENNDSEEWEYCRDTLQKGGFEVYDSCLEHDCYSGNLKLAKESDRDISAGVQYKKSITYEEKQLRFKLMRPHLVAKLLDDIKATGAAMQVISFHPLIVDCWGSSHYRVSDTDSFTLDLYKRTRKKAKQAKYNAKKRELMDQILKLTDGDASILDAAIKDASFRNKAVRKYRDKGGT